MSVQRFFGASNRDAMQRVRTALGDDALVLSNRSTADGVEILALPERDVSRLADAAGSEPAAAAVTASPQPVQRRGTSPSRDRLWNQLRVAGFSKAFGEDLLASMPDPVDRQWLVHRLQTRLRVAGEHALLRSRVVIVLGPTGVGKTLTAAKLATRYVAEHGARGVAMVGADIYRTGAMLQLRGYADPLGVDLHTMEADLELADVVAGLADKQLIIVDAPGFGPHDPRLAEQVRWLCADVDATPVLLLGAGQQAEALDDAVVHYRRVVQAAGAQLNDVIVTKQDEASRMGPVLEAVMRHDLCVHFVSGGQHLSRDLVAADATALVAEAMMAPARDVHAEAVPLAHRMLRQGHALGRALSSLRDHVSGFARLQQAWALRALPPPDQASAMDDLPAPPEWMMPEIYLWRSGRQPGVHALDRAGLPLPMAGAWPSMPDWLDAVCAGNRQAMTGSHLLPNLPSLGAWKTLCTHDLAWACSVRARQQVWHGGKQRDLQTCRSLAGEAQAHALRYRGRAVQAMLRPLPVAVLLPGRKVSGLFTAWFVDVRAADSGAVVARHHMLTPVGMDVAQARILVLANLRSVAVPALVARAHSLLSTHAEAVPGPVCDCLGDGFVAMACWLDWAEQEWAMDVRVQLRNLAGPTSARGPAGVLAALVTLLETCAALQLINKPIVGNEGTGSAS